MAEQEPPRIEFPCEYPIKVLGRRSDESTLSVMTNVHRYAACCSYTASQFERSVAASPPSPGVTHVSRPHPVAMVPLTRELGLADYQPVFDAMREFTDARDEHTPDELWLLQHPRVFTQGQAGRAEHVLAPGDIPVIQVDRGGQVTYHGPGQWVIYLLVDLKRRGMGVRSLVTLIEDSIVKLLVEYGIAAAARPDAPGVYVDGDKIASLGLRVRRGSLPWPGCCRTAHWIWKPSAGACWPSSPTPSAE